MHHLYSFIVTLKIMLSLPFSQSMTWIAVIDQINEPWLLLIGEDGRQRQVHQTQCVDGLREGMWVSYDLQKRRVTRLEDPKLIQKSLDIERELRKQFERLTRNVDP